MRKLIVLCSLVLFLLMILSGCVKQSKPFESQVAENETVQLQESLNDFIKMLDGSIPEDVRLTIYFMAPTTMTRTPLNIESLIASEQTQKIVVDAEELVMNQASLNGTDFLSLQLVDGEPYLNARVYYVFEKADSTKILEVAMWGYDKDSSCVFVNGIAVEDDPCFLALIEPFLPEEARDKGTVLLSPSRKAN